MINDLPQRKSKPNKDPHKNLIIPDLSLGKPIDLKQIQLEGYLEFPYDQGSIAEKYRGIKWEILNHHRFPSRGKTLLIASASVGEGKSAAAFNLAVSMSLERDWKSILVDTSGNANSITSLLNLNQCKGLTDYLVGDINLEMALYETSQAKCYVVPIGQQIHLRSELIASTKMVDFFQKIQEFIPSSFVILDSRAIRSYADCKVLSTRVDRILMVVEASVTPKLQVEEALYFLPKEKLIGVIMNKDPWK
ncbi:MAG TPA: hypothetical protein VFP93_00530 [Gammaproteobacteria bacterium]|nr:hypothetical protein [Gammaproteobacteria bacterium]